MLNGLEFHGSRFRCKMRGTGDPIVYVRNLWSLLQNSGWMSGNPTLSPFSGWNEVHGGSMDRNFNSEMGQSGEADRRSRVLQEALWIEDC